MIGLQRFARTQNLMIGNRAKKLNRYQRNCSFFANCCCLGLVITLGTAALPCPARSLTSRTRSNPPSSETQFSAAPNLLAQSQPVLTLGSTGKSVSELQATLKRLGYHKGAVDGIYGESTAQAVSNFQKASGLQVDGVVGAATWNRLYLAVRNMPKTTATNSLIQRPVVQLGSEGKEVSELQAALKLLGYYVGPVDGRYGETTAAAVAKFQTDSGLQSDGIAGPATWNRLFPPVPTEEPPKANNTNTADNAAGTQADCNCDRGTGSSARTNNATSTSNVALPILRVGMRGPAIVNLQERLQALGFLKGSADGVFGPTTEAAVKAAQRQSQLNPDGIVGPATWNILLR